MNKTSSGVIESSSETCFELKSISSGGLCDKPKDKFHRQ